MNYGIYQSVRNAAWQCLIDCGITELPLKPVIIAQKYGVNCKRATAEYLKGKSGEILRDNNRNVIILTNVNDIVKRRRYTIMHELGHFVLGHLGNEPLSRSESDCRPEEEQAADKFAINMLAPACVLWGLDLHTPEEIAKVCDISMQAATYRAERMKILYKRNKFFTEPIERDVYKQFEDFIKNNR